MVSRGDQEPTRMYIECLEQGRLAARSDALGKRPPQGTNGVQTRGAGVAYHDQVVEPRRLSAPDELS